ncbi:MAG: GspN family type II secretion system protein ExeN [Aliiglaciecola sp.]
MNQVIKWVLLGLVVYLVFLLAKLPASQVIHRIPLPDNIIVSNVEGTIWSGNAGNVFINNIAIDNVHWEASFWSLLIGNLSLDIEAGTLRDSSTIFIQGPLVVDMFNPNHIQTHDLSIYVPAKMAIAQVSLPVYADASGRFRVDIQELDYFDACRSLTGTGQWINAGLSGLQGLNAPLDLGNFSADLRCDGEQVLVQVKQPNVFNLTADVRVAHDAKWSIDGRFKPADELPEQVKSAAQFFGRTDAQGFYNIKF